MTENTIILYSELSVSHHNSEPGTSLVKVRNHTA